MQKFFVEGNQINNDKIYIQGSDLKHILNVLLKIEITSLVVVAETLLMQNQIFC